MNNKMMNKKAYWSMEQAIWNAGLTLMALFIFYVFFISPHLSVSIASPEKTPIQSVTELQNKFDATSKNLSEYFIKYNNCENKDYINKLERETDSMTTGLAWSITFLIIFAVTIILFAFKLVDRNKRIGNLVSVITELKDKRK